MTSPEDTVITASPGRTIAENYANRATLRAALAVIGQPTTVVHPDPPKGANVPASP